MTRLKLAGQRQVVATDLILSRFDIDYQILPLVLGFYLDADPLLVDLSRSRANLFGAISRVSHVVSPSDRKLLASRFYVPRPDRVNQHSRDVSLPLWAEQMHSDARRHRGRLLLLPGVESAEFGRSESGKKLGQRDIHAVGGSGAAVALANLLCS